MEPLSPVRLHVSEASSILPIVARIADLLGCARDEVPPHENRVRERRTADQQQTRTAVTCEGCVSALHAQVVEDSLSERLTIECAIAGQDQHGIFEVGPQRYLELSPRCTCRSAPAKSER